MSTRRVLLVLFVASLFLAPTSAFAQDDGPSFLGNGGATFWFFTKTVDAGPPEGESTVTSYQAEIFGSYEVMPKIDVTLDWGVTNTSIAPGEGDSVDDFSMGNPFIAGHYAFMDNAGIKATAGLGIGIPLATLPEFDLNDPAESAGRFSNLITAMSMRGMQALWLYAPDTLSVVVPVKVQAKYKSGLRAGGELAFGAFIPTGDSDDAETDMGLDLVVEASFKAGVVEPGMRLGLNYGLSSDADDVTQMFVEPFVKADFGAGFARIGFSMNIDEPAGFAFDDEGFWGLNVGGGANF